MFDRLQTQCAAQLFNLSVCFEECFANRAFQSVPVDNLTFGQKQVVKVVISLRRVFKVAVHFERRSHALRLEEVVAGLLGGLLILDILA